ncbi:13365_t:CDS:2, partial [Dentiscutata heterogama]
AREYDNQAQQSYIAAPILSDEEANKQELVIMDLDYQLGDRENQFENKDDEILLSSKWDTDFSLGGREKYSANDEMAKWSLESLFLPSLEMPLYFDLELTSNR